MVVKALKGEESAPFIAFRGVIEDDVEIDLHAVLFYGADERLQLPALVVVLAF